MKLRVEIVRGPDHGQVFMHDTARGLTFRVSPDDLGLLEHTLAKLQRRALPTQPVLYRMFTRAAPYDRGADAYAAEWCAEHDAFADRCPHAPDAPIRRWVRFGPRRDQTQLFAGAPGARESKWHLLQNWRQVEEPWLAACELVVYGPIVEEYRHAVLTPIGMPMCKNCKKVAGVEERGVIATGGAGKRSG